MKAGELIAGGAIGRVLPVINLAPHRLSQESRPDWFFNKEQYGGILTDIGSHQFEQFLAYTGARDAEINFARVANFDHPDAFDHDLLADHLADLVEGKSISHPIYDYKTHSRMKETRTVGSHSIIIFEGILILNEPRLRDLMDIRVFIDTAPDICFIRRLTRDINERARSVESIITQYEETVRPMYFQFIEPSKRYADIIIPRGGKNEVAIDILSTKINTLLDRQNL